MAKLSDVVGLGAQGPQGSQGSQGSPGLNWTGDWSGATSYILDDVAFSGGTSYVCISAHTNQAPPNATYWDIVASLGDQGSQGDTGAQGTQGAQGSQGNDGAQGAQGTQGSTGAQGTQGAQGSTGAQGTQGPQGSQGASGGGSLDSLTDTDITSVGANEFLRRNPTNTDWINQTANEAKITERDNPAVDSNPAAAHLSYTAINSGTRTITIASQPSVYQPVAASNITFNFSTSGISLPYRGLNDVGFSGVVFTNVTVTSITGITIRLDNGTANLYVFGDPPLLNGDVGILSWRYFDDGTTKRLIASWVSE